MTTSPDFADITALVFDLDGTLLDSFAAHFAAYLAMFTRLGFPMTEADFFASYTPNWLEAYERVGLPRERWAEADALWLEEAHKRPPALFPKTAEVLARLSERRPLALVTSGSRERVLGDLQRNAIRDRFEVIITGSDVTQPKPAPDGLQQALRALSIGPHQAVYIGDAQADWEMARAAGVAFIGIPSRFASLTAATPCRQIHALEDLLELFGA